MPLVSNNFSFNFKSPVSRLRDACFVLGAITKLFLSIKLIAFVVEATHASFYGFVFLENERFVRLKLCICDLYDVGRNKKVDINCRFLFSKVANVKP